MLFSFVVRQRNAEVMQNGRESNMQRGLPAIKGVDLSFLYMKTY